MADVTDARPAEGADEESARLWNELEEADRRKDAGEATPGPETDKQPAAPADTAAAAGSQPEKPNAAPAIEADAGKTTEQQPDVWANADPALKAAHEAVLKDREKERTEFKRMSGTVAGYQRQVKDLQAQLEQHRAAPAARTPAKQPGKAPASILDDPELKKAKEEYPEVMGPVERVLRAIEERTVSAEQRNANLEKALGGLSAKEQERFYERQEQELTKAHPDWKDVTAKPEFGEWLNSQPRYVREAIVRNGQNIVDPEEAADVLLRFKTHLGIQTKAPEDKPSAGHPAAADTSATALKRKQQLESASAPRGRGPVKVAATDGPPEGASEQEIWDYYERQDRAKGKAR